MKLKVRLEVRMDDELCDSINLDLYNKLNEYFEQLVKNDSTFENFTINHISVSSIIKIDENKSTDDRAYDFFSSFSNTTDTAG